LEHFLTSIRYDGRTPDHPCPLSFKYRMKAYLLGRHNVMGSANNSNTSLGTDKVVMYKNNISQLNLSSSTIKKLLPVDYDCSE